MNYYRLDVVSLNRAMGVNLEKGTYRNERRKRVYLLPFPTRNPERVLFDNGFMPIIAGAFRKLNGLSMEGTAALNEIESIVELGNYKDEKAKTLFSGFLKSELSEIQLGKVHDLSQIIAIPMSDKKTERIGELDLMHYVHDTFLANSSDEFIEAMSFQLPENIALQLLIPKNKVVQSTKKKLYSSHFKKLEKQFKKDFLLLLKHPNFLIQNIDLFFAHYTFISLSQMILQVSRFEQFSEDNWIGLYFLYQEEKSARWREAYKRGYELVRSSMANFYVHEHLINIVSQVPFIKYDNALYSDIYQELKKQSDYAENEYVQSLHQWMEENYLLLNETERSYERKNTAPEVWREMYDLIRPNISKEINSRFSLAFESLFSKYYYKHGGSLGKLTGLSQRQVLLLVALAVGEERLELNKLWDELEKRGVYLDHKTREVIIETLDRLNYIEKQSDSGDAQYVKPVL